jgi:hypothetical protein
VVCELYFTYGGTSNGINLQWTGPTPTVVTEMEIATTSTGGGVRSGEYIGTTSLGSPTVTWGSTLTASGVFPVQFITDIKVGSSGGATMQLQASNTSNSITATIKQGSACFWNVTQ